MIPTAAAPAARASVFGSGTVTVIEVISMLEPEAALKEARQPMAKESKEDVIKVAAAVVACSLNNVLAELTELPLYRALLMVRALGPVKVMR